MTAVAASGRGLSGLLAGKWLRSADAAGRAAMENDRFASSDLAPVDDFFAPLAKLRGNKRLRADEETPRPLVAVRRPLRDALSPTIQPT
jgi:hypothetical protein